MHSNSIRNGDSFLCAFRHKIRVGSDSTNLISFYDKMAHLVYQGIIALDSRKVFATISHKPDGSCSFSQEAEGQR